MGNPEKLAILGTQDIRRKQINQETQYNTCWMPSYTRHRTKTKEAKKHNTICVGHHYTQANTNNVNKT
jgi:hypothetical protein